MKKIIILLILLLIAVSQGAYAQLTIFGRVADAETGSSIPGASVTVKGTITGGVTNSSGNFALMNVPEDATLQVSYIGYKTVELPVENQTRFEITLEPDVQALGEVVVTADREERERVITGAMGIERDPRTIPYAVSVISGDEIRESGDFYFMRTLVGRVPGIEVIVDNITGLVYAYLRNINSFANGRIHALYVLDGIPISVETASTINPYDIENITVLRGANAAMLYGSAGVGGAVLITTKKR